MSRVGHDDALPQDAIVGNVAVRHQVAVVPYYCSLSSSHGAAMNRDILSNDHARPYIYSGLFTSVREILGRAPDAGKLKNARSISDRGFSLDRDMGTNFTIVTDDRPFADNSVRSDRDVVT
jgi:hypothetical protein